MKDLPRSRFCAFVCALILLVAASLPWLLPNPSVSKSNAVFVRAESRPPGGNRYTMTFRPGAAYCYAPDTPDEVMRKNPFPAPLTGAPSIDYNLTGRWSGTTGTPRALTWSFIPDGVTVDGQTNELFSKMDALFAAQGGRATWIGVFQQAFARWSTLAGLTYTRITTDGNDWDDGAAFGSGGSSSRGDVRIAMILQDGPSSVLAYNYYPSNGDMVLDRDENWASSFNSFRFMRNILLHEHGHGIGLQHVCPTTQSKLMEPFLTTSFDGPQHDDIRGAQRLYGDPFELHNSVATAKALGTLALNTPLTLGAVPAPNVANGSLLSIESSGKFDYFKFTIDSPLGANVTVTPVGLTYDSSTQNANGSCNSGSNINSLAIADLAFDVIATNGTTVLQSVNATSAGSAETVSNVVLSAAGTYYVKVYLANTPSQSQLYSITISTSDCNANGVSDGIDIQNGTSEDCEGDLVPDECEINGATDTNNNLKLDTCERHDGDFDLDGDVDITDFAHLQACMQGPGTIPPACADANLNTDTAISSNDVSIFLNCLSGADTPYNPACN